MAYSQPQQNPYIQVAPHILLFYDSTSSYNQYYRATDLLGWEKVNSTSFKIYMKGVHDVNAKDVITITHTAAITYNDAVRAIYLGMMSFQTGVQGEPIITLDVNILKVITEPTTPNLVPEFTSCTISYGSCCGSGADKEKGVGKIMTVGATSYIPITQTDFMSEMANTRGPGSDGGLGFNTQSLSHPAWFEEIVPLGWKVTGGVIYGDGTTNRFEMYQGTIVGHTLTAKTSVNTVNVPADITDDGNTDIVGDGLVTVIFKLDNRSLTDNFYGGKIFVEQIS